MQISDTHFGFKGEANPDVPGTVRRAVEMINALPTRPAFVVHTGDITHLSKPQEFDDAAHLLNEIKVDRVHYIPGEHDMLDDGPAGYLKRYGADKNGNGWFSFDHGGGGSSQVLERPSGVVPRRAGKRFPDYASSSAMVTIPSACESAIQVRHACSLRASATRASDLERGYGRRMVPLQKSQHTDFKQLFDVRNWLRMVRNQERF